MISIIIPVFNEMNTINKTIESICQSQKNTDFEIIVVDADIQEKTLKVIENTNVKKITSPKGRSKQMNKGVDISLGSILLFLHADTELPENALKKIADFMNKETYVGGAFDLYINSQKKIYRFIEAVASIRSRITKIPYGDQAVFIKKEYFLEIGGFPDFPLMEDVELMLKIKKARKKIIIFPEKVKTSSRRWEKEGVVYCTLRNWLLVTMYYLGVHPDKLVNFYK